MKPLRHLHGIALAALCGWSLAAHAQESADDAAPVERTVSGRYACTTLDEGAACGHEDWIITAQGDGTRTLRSYSFIEPIAFQNSTVMRVDDAFRPLDGFTNLYRGGAFFGSGFYVVDGSTLTTTVNGPEGTFTEELDVPDNVALLLYPNAAYGWMLGTYDHDRGGAQNVTMCVLAATGQSAACGLADQAIAYVGDETITVPAGTFDTSHYTIGKNGDTWITGPDRMVVQHQHRVRNLRFQLTDVTGAE